MGAAFRRQHTLMDRMITTLAEMPAVAGRTLKYFIRKGESAKRLSRRTGVLAVGAGLILFGPVTSMKGGGLEEFGIDILSTLTIEAVEYGVDSGLNAINDPTGITGVLMGLLGDTTTGQLDKISSQVTVAQDMIAGLQSDLDTFEAGVEQTLTQVIINQDQAAYVLDMAPIKADLTSLNSLTQEYSNVVASCYSNGVLKTVLSQSDRTAFNTLVTDANWANVPDRVLNDLVTATSTAFDTDRKSTSLK